MSRVIKALAVLLAGTALTAYLALLAQWVRPDPSDPLVRRGQPERQDYPAMRVIRDRPGLTARGVSLDPSVLPDHLAARVRRAQQADAARRARQDPPDHLARWVK